ncbi:ion channel [Desulfosporosinus shakirovi]|uniref:ion channel n=1 Tax=Desulfosporosinus shakirovi TaxID=2885154 RepID=UPI001E51C3A1|nr:ion channel [Desulfosporosinus sp. SRJS8]MCB8816554.1 potassium channel family protein [Desulfosporosinus sp. SRJS8]
MVRRVWNDFVTLVVTLIVGTVGLMVTEHLSLARAIYLTVQTVTTIGFGDIEPQTYAGIYF